MLKNLIIAGRSLWDFGVVISGEGTYNGASREVEVVSVPGRNGDLLMDMGRYENTPLKYPVSIAKNFPYNAAQLRAFLASLIGYQRIQDDYHPEFFRMGRFVGPLEFAVGVLSRHGEATLAFDCMPQRFAVAGETPVELTAPASLKNPYLYEALPLIAVYGSGAGALTVGESLVEISDVDSTLTLDSDTQNAYKGVENKNNTVAITGGFPKLPAGETAISWTGGITKVVVTPRWWTI